MFEKDAEEYRLNLVSELREKIQNGCNCKELIDIEMAFQKGAEFGYNKANEWHYVKDELPPIKKEYCGRSELVLVVSKNKQMQYAQYVEKEKTWARGICAIGFEPYAWKEIVLPELPKEIE